MRSIAIGNSPKAKRRPCAVCWYTPPRLVTELTLGRGEAGHLVALDEVALELAAQGLAAAWPLGSSLRYYRHAVGKPGPA